MAGFNGALTAVIWISLEIVFRVPYVRGGNGEECKTISDIPCSCFYKDSVISFEDYPSGVLAAHSRLELGVREYIYYYSPCKPLGTTIPGINFPNSLLCQKNNFTKDLFKLGSTDFSTSGIPETDLFYFEYATQLTDGDYRKSRVYVRCDPEPFHSFNFLNQSDGSGKTEENPLIYEFSYTGPEGCLQRAKNAQHKLSGGSVLLIILLVVVVLYLGIGLIYNKFFKGAVGVEVIPNYEFWVGLPSLVSDGVLFTLKCGCCKNTSASAYENI